MSFLLIFSCLLLIITFSSSLEFKINNIMINHTKGYDAYRIPGLISCSSNIAIAFAEGRKYGCGDFDGQHDLVMKRTINRGETWNDLIILIDASKYWSNYPNSVIWDPTPVYDEVTNELFLWFSRSLHPYTGRLDMWMMSSKDCGETWSKAKNMTDCCMPNHMTPVNGKGLSYINEKNEYILMIPIYSSIGENILLSKDHGKTWKVLMKDAICPKSSEGEIVSLNNGKQLLWALRNDNAVPCENGLKACRLWARSNDGGATWFNISTSPSIRDPNCKAGILQASSKHLLLSNADSSTHRINQTIHISNDNGYSYPKKILIDKLSGYSTMTKFEDDVVLLAFERGGCTISTTLIKL